MAAVLGGNPFAHFEILARGNNPLLVGISTDSMDPNVKHYVDTFLFRCLRPGDIVLIEAPYTGEPCNPLLHPQVVRCAGLIHALGVTVFGWDSTVPVHHAVCVNAQDGLRASQELLQIQSRTLQAHQWGPLKEAWEYAGMVDAVIGGVLQHDQVQRDLPTPSAADKANALYRLAPLLAAGMTRGARVFVLYEDSPDDVLIAEQLNAMGATVITPRDGLPIDPRTVGQEMLFIASGEEGDNNPNN